MNPKDKSEPAFPGAAPGYKPAFGMTMRDYFATHADRDSISDITSRSLSLIAKEALVGRKKQSAPRENASREEIIKYQISVFEFEAELDCILRFKMADAMLAERAK